MRQFIMLIALLVSGTSAESQQKPDNSAIDSAFVAEVRNLLSASVVEIAIGAQNDRYQNIGSSEITALDNQWRSERDTYLQPLIASILNNPLSTYLTQIQAISGGLYTEIFVMDAKGLNVGQSSITSDFWQGDEAKYQQTYLVSSDAVFLDEPEFHEGSKTWRSQLNLTLVGGNGASIGAATVEINLTELNRRLGQ